MPMLQLSPADIDDSQMPCTGAQVATILDLLSKQSEIEACHWYAGALQVFGSPLVPQYGREPVRIEHFDRFIEQIGLVVQLDDGIIFAMKGEDEPIPPRPSFTTLFHYGGTKVGNSVIELHAFDTSWVELYSNDVTLMKRVAKRFPGGIWHD